MPRIRPSYQPAARHITANVARLPGLFLPQHTTGQGGAGAAIEANLAVMLKKGAHPLERAASLRRSLCTSRVRGLKQKENNGYFEKFHDCRSTAGGRHFTRYGTIWSSNRRRTTSGWWRKRQWRQSGVTRCSNGTYDPAPQRHVHVGTEQPSQKAGNWPADAEAAARTKWRLLIWCANRKQRPRQTIWSRPFCLAAISKRL